mmetsp:Transcript_67878/g.178023  ORF Transcript_67878/g.178023 Transcript_67878/m.178023 type:complete len:381 (+) Transcript_67878:360-1502(+)
MTISPAAAEPIPMADTRCGRIIGVVLLCYGAFNTYLYVKFTPVYTATECGVQAATLDKLELGESSIHVGLNIKVTCLNPNPYSIDILTSEEGEVFIGQTDRLSLGRLRVLPGSALPERGSGTVEVRMDAELSGETAEHLLPHFLEDREIPLLLNLHFNVGVQISFGLASWGTTAPFKKACGLNMGGLLRAGSGNRMGPMVCVDDFDSLVIPPVTDPTPADGRMSFSAAQMDPERIQMGERIKNVSIINVMLICYVLGLWLLRSWFSETCCNVRDAVTQRSMAVVQPQEEVVERSALGSLVFTVLKHTPFGSGATRRDGYTAAQKELLQVDGGGREAQQSRMESLRNFLNCRSSVRRPGTATIAKPEPPSRTPRWGFSSNV